jgi:hypothetical protein
MHGFQTLVQPVPFPAPTDTTVFLPTYFATLAADLVTDGWVVIWPLLPGDGVGNLSQVQAVYNDIASDPGRGERHLNCRLRWWDHAVPWIYANYGPTWPIVPIGFSDGGMIVLQIASQRQSTIAAYCAHHPGINPANFNPAFTSPVNFGSIDTSGLVVPTNALNSVTVPGMLGWGTVDTAVDYPNSGDLLTPALYSAALGAGAPVSPNADGTGNAIGHAGGSGSENHVLSTNDVTQIRSWLSGLGFAASH